MSSDHPTLLIVAGFVEDESPALHTYRYDQRQGTLREVAAFGEGVRSPLFVAVDPTRRFAYVADHVSECDGQPGGAVAAYALDANQGQLKFLNRQSARGTVPCYLSVSRDGRCVLVANYGDGNVAALGVGADGRLAPAGDVRSHSQTEGDQPRAHSIVLDAADRFALAADLGVDHIFSYRVDTAGPKLTPNDPPSIQTAAKAGPRHLAFHPNGRHVYAMTEYDNTVIAMRYDAESGQVEILEVQAALPDSFSGKSYGSDIHIHPSGRFLYAANRGHDSLVIFAVDPDSGRLTRVGHQPTGGQFPRDFVLDPAGRFLLVGNEQSDRIVSFAVDQEKGTLTPTGAEVAVSRPACLAFA